MKYLILILAFGACVLSVSSANIPSVPQTEENLKSESLARGGWGAQEVYSGPPSVAFALPIALGLIFVLWIAAYNTLRSPPPKIGFGGGAQGSGPGGWGQANLGWGVNNQAAVGGWAAPATAGGWAAPATTGGWTASGSQVYPEYAEAPGSVAAGTSPQQGETVAAAVEQTVAGTGSRSFNDMTHRILRSIERQEQAQHS